MLTTLLGSETHIKRVTESKRKCHLEKDSERNRDGEMEGQRQTKDRRNEKGRERERGLCSALLAQIIGSQQRRDSSISTVFSDGQGCH